jgi:hypothetical protein
LIIAEIYHQRRGFHVLIEGFVVNITDKGLSDVTNSFRTKSKNSEGTHLENNLAKILFFINNQQNKQ